MVDVVLFHHIQGPTEGVDAFAEDLRGAGHTVHAPDLFEGRTFDSVEDGFTYARGQGFDTIRQRGLDAAEQLGPDLVYIGLSFGVTIAQRLVQTRPGARGAVFLYSCLPLSEFGGAWPGGVPVQVHGAEDDEFFDEDLPAARELVTAVGSGELFLYPGDQHLFGDSSLPSYDASAASVLGQRVLAFLGSLETP